MLQLRRFLGTPGLLLSLAIVMAGLYGMDQFLARLERRELRAESGHEYQHGIDALNAGHTAAAISHLMQAHQLDRTNAAYQITLADALIRLGDLDRAADRLNAVLALQSNGGEANLFMARLTARRGNFDEANAYFHRAIYGTWKSNEADQRMQARLELVEMLARLGDQANLFSELLPLQQGAQTNLEIARRIPALYLQAGSLERAESAYNNMLRHEPGDPEALAGLGRVALQRGNYRAAVNAFTNAMRREPDDPSLKAFEQTASRALDFDPTPRYLSSREKVLRSNRILDLTRTTILSCLGDQMPSSEISDLLVIADQQLKQNIRAANNEMAEARLDLATHLFNERPQTCAASQDDLSLLTILYRKIGAQ